MYRVRLIVIVLLGSLLTGCGEETPTVTPPPAPTQPLASPAVHLVMAVQGELLVQPEGGGEFVPAPIGTLLSPGDQLQLAAGSTATLLCADLQEAAVAIGTGSIPCSATDPVLTYDNSPPPPTLGSVSDSFDYPVVIAPRKTRVLAVRPTLHWLDSRGNGPYQVTITGPGFRWDYPSLVDSSRLDYPTDAPALQPGVAYRVIIQAGGHSSDEDPVNDPTFKLLNSTIADQVNKSATNIRNRHLSDVNERQALAVLFASYGLFGEATDQIEGSAPEQRSSSLEYLLAGYYHNKLLLNGPAEEHYQRAYDLAPGNEQRRDRANAAFGLGITYEGAGSDFSTQACDYYRTARDLYTQLKYTNSATNAKNRMNRLGCS